MKKPTAPDAVTVHVPGLDQRDRWDRPIIDTTGRPGTTRCAWLGQVHSGPASGQVGVHVWTGGALTPSALREFAGELFAMASAADAEQRRHDLDDERARDLELVARSMTRGEVQTMVGLAAMHDAEVSASYWTEVAELQIALGVPA